MRVFLFVILSAVVIVCLILGGCSSNATTTPAATTTPVATTTVTTATTATTATTTPAVQPIYGGTLRLIVDRAPKNLGDPSKSGLSARILTVEPLTLFDTEGNLVPWLVTSWEMDPDAKTITFKVRQGVKFHDGTDYNAEAVKWNWEQAMSYGRITGGSDVKSIDVLDTYTVRLTFNRFSAMYIIAFTHSIPQVSPTAVETNGKDWAKTHGVGTGPFRQVDFTADSYLKTVRFDDYWGTKPYYDGVDYIAISDPTVAVLTMRSGDADMWDASFSLSAIDAKGMKDAGLQVIQRQAMVSFLAGDGANPESVFANKQVREALEYALDRDAIAAARGAGSYEPLYQFANPTNMGYNPDIQPRKYDPAKARELLADAGYPDGFDTTIIFENSQSAADTCTLIQSYLAAVGIMATLDPADTARWMSIARANGTGWTDGLIFTATGINAGIDYLRWTVCSTISPQPKAQNLSILKTPEYVALWDQTIYARTLSEAEESGKKLLKQLFDDALVVPLYNSPYTVIAQNYVHTNYLSVHHQIWNPELDWMDKH